MKIKTPDQVGTRNALAAALVVEPQGQHLVASSTSVCTRVEEITGGIVPPTVYPTPVYTYTTAIDCELRCPRVGEVSNIIRRTIAPTQQVNTTANWGSVVPVSKTFWTEYNPSTQRVTQSLQGNTAPVSLLTPTGWFTNPTRRDRLNLWISCKRFLGTWKATQLVLSVTNSPNVYIPDMIVTQPPSGPDPLEHNIVTEISKGFILQGVLTAHWSPSRPSGSNWQFHIVMQRLDEP